MTNLRVFLAAVFILSVVALSAAQQSTKVWKIGVLVSATGKAITSRKRPTKW